MPAHEARWPSVGNTAMSAPISAGMTSAERWPTPGMEQSSSTSVAKGPVATSIRSLSVPMSSSRSRRGPAPLSCLVRHSGTHHHLGLADIDAGATLDELVELLHLRPGLLRHL